MEFEAAALSCYSSPEKRASVATRGREEGNGGQGDKNRRGVRWTRVAEGEDDERTGMVK